MGRARGGPHSLSTRDPAPARRTAAPAPPSPAELLGVPTNPHAPERATGPTGPPIVSVRGVSLYQADSVDAGLRVPSTDAEGMRAYPQVPREGCARLDGALWQRLVRTGRTYRSEQLRSMLHRAGVGANALNGRSGGGRSEGGKSEGPPLSDERLREELHAWAHEGLIPAGSDVLLPDGARGFGVLRSRAACDAYAEHLRGRHRSQLGSLQEMRDRAPHWYAASADERAAWPVSGVSPEQAEVILRSLDGGQWRKGHELADALWGGEIGDGVASRGSSVRKLAAQMRSAGVPIIASPAHGYRLAANTSEVQTYTEGELGRTQAVEAHAKQVERAGALWYPRDDDSVEVAAARQWRAGLHRAPTAPATLKREAGRRAQAEKREQKRLTTREVAAERETELMTSPLYARMLSKSMTGEPLDRAEREFARELKQQRRAKRSGRAPTSTASSGAGKPSSRKRP